MMHQKIINGPYHEFFSLSFLTKYPYDCPEKIEQIVTMQKLVLFQAKFQIFFIPPFVPIFGPFSLIFYFLSLNI